MKIFSIDFSFFFYSRYYDSSDLGSSTFSKWDDNSDAFWKKESNSRDTDILLTSKSTGFSDRYTKKTKLIFLSRKPKFVNVIWILVIVVGVSSVYRRRIWPELPSAVKGSPDWICFVSWISSLHFKHCLLCSELFSPCTGGNSQTLSAKKEVDKTWGETQIFSLFWARTCLVYCVMNQRKLC